MKEAVIKASKAQNVDKLYFKMLQDIWLTYQAGILIHVMDCLSFK